MGRLFVPLALAASASQASAWTHAATGLEMVDVPAVSFEMGADAAMVRACSGTREMTDVTPHAVSLDGFAMSQTEVTVAQYADFLNEALAAGLAEVRTSNVNDAWYWKVFHFPEDRSPYSFVVDKETGRYWVWLDAPPPVYDEWMPDNVCHVAFDAEAQRFSVDNPAFADWPMALVSWYGAEAFADYYGLQLPTEAQWEYAAGGGGRELATGHLLSVKQVYPSHSHRLSTAEMNFNGDEFAEGLPLDGGDSQPTVGHPMAVGSYGPNDLGFHDLGGNVFEWLADAYDEDYYTLCDTAPESAECVDGVMVNPAGPSDFVEPLLDGSCQGAPWLDYTCDTRVRRGGAWNYHGDFTCSFHREKGLPFRMLDHFGFRVVDSVGEPGSLSSSSTAMHAASATELVSPSSSTSSSSAGLWAAGAAAVVTVGVAAKVVYGRRRSS